MASKFFYSEYFDGNRAILNGWTTQPPLSGRSLVADFPMHWALQSACDGGNARVLDGAGYTSWRPDLTCTFVDNPDTDTSPGQQVISNKLLAYAFLLSTEGYPFVYGKDYFPPSVWPGAYGLKPWIDNLVWIHEHLAVGPTSNRFLDDKVIVLNRTGAPGLLTALNFDTMNARTISCQTAFGANVDLHDYTGHHDDIRTDGNGVASFTIPSNAFSRGQSYLCFSRAGLNVASIRHARPTTQTIFGAADLDTRPATNAETEAGQIWLEQGSRIALHVSLDRRGVPADSSLKVTVTDAQGHNIVEALCSSDHVSAEGTTGATGEHHIRVAGRQLPDHGAAFSVDVTYLAPQII